MIEFCGIYAPYIKDYIEFKRSLGYCFSMEYLFKDFDSFTLEQECSTVGLTKELCDLWGTRRPNETEVNCYKRINDIRNFSIYLNSLGYKSYVSVHNAKHQSTFVPYIFTKAEIQKFFYACDSLPITGYSVITQTLPAVFRLIYGCGLRVNEALFLKCDDVNLEEQYIVIRKTKNDCDRILPFTDSVADALKKYMQYRKQLQFTSEYFFVKKDGDQCSSDSVYRWFRRILYHAGISHGGKGKGPRVHDLRHSFSVHTLAAMAENGLDLYYSLPIISKYLGHNSLEATDKYVRLTANMYPGILNKMNSICSYVFPEVNNYETE
ncbi:tyrosine-type recombinase/integrase [Thermoanaerobacterium sp. CMT5567-10]|uniref:tyrosine-type recombinase/integrase n=1 Tax=Thermoanaerobacterium sp. CMT5567-10 TaxID=3061989 RepID=UPI0026DFD6B8|nr:tyrosine-type recombinase/integrase [Thermoanaerobacterium sp. CMT5567-10]WKV08584.1 tyrosine-type recombinase/integrase [Thermoanaerobacterium sp. CMT5567-10]